MTNFGSNLLTTLNGLVSSGNTSGAATLASIFHLGAMQGKVDYKAKTMTISWEQANKDAAPLLLAEGFTIIPD
jgi:hypothetical protein